MNISIISYHIVGDFAAYHIPAANDNDAKMTAELFGVTGKLYRHFGYRDAAGLDHIVSVEEVRDEVLAL